MEFLASSRKLQLEEHTLRSKGLEGLDIVLRSLIDILKVSSTDQDFTDEEKYPEEFQSLETVNSYISNTLCESATNVDNISPPSNLDNSKVAVETFDRKQKMQEEIEVGILKFNLSPKKGLQYLVSSGHLVLEPNRIAEFLHFHQERLDKTAVGDFLGREREYENGLCLSVLHEYVEQMNFENMPFDMAIRHFLSGFRLPGEAQKIDRIMEKFAERYYLQNSDVFASADMAFILAFSTIMLQTNLHNPAIRDDKRMTKEQFIKQNKGITADGELPDQLLSEIYDRISSQPISINQDEKFRKSKKDEHTSFVVFQATNDRKKKDAFNSERLEMVKAGEAMFRQASKRGSTFLRNTGENGVIENKYVKPMYEITWPPVIGVISYVIESLDDNTLIMSAISIFQKSIALAGRLDISVARNTFINTLAKFTTLDTIREMHEKNILCIRLLIELALTEGNYLEESWTQILLVLSQLSRLQLFATGSHSDAIFFSDSYAESSAKISGKRPLLFNTSVERHSSSRQSTSFSDPISKLFLGPSKAETARLVEEANADLVTKGIDSYQIDRIFLNSATLNATSVKFLVDSLCEVSLLEISGGTTNGNRLKDITHESAPRVFSLQKLVEVADCNMHIRSRLDWSRIWSLLAKHFSTVGIHENIALAMYAIDSLKQLSIKFLQKEELSNFNFQRLFLKPFEVIISNTKCHEIKDLVLRCIEIMIRSCATNIRSGWKTIFLILEVSAEHDEFETAALAYTILNTQMQDNFQLLVHDFVELLNCVVSFTASVHTKLSIQALDSIALCAEKLATGSIVFSSVASPNVVDQQLESLEKMHSLEVGEDSSVFKLWWPLLLGLSTRISDCRFQVRDKALKTLKFVLFQYGSSFSSQIWSVIFRGILFPIVDSARTDTSNQPKARWPTEIIENFVDENSWICSTLLNVLEFFRDLYFHVHLKDEHHGLLRELFKLLVGLICRETENIGKISISVFFSMITCLRDIHEEHQYEKEVGKMISHSICECLLANLCIHFNSLGSISLEGVVSVEKLDDISFCSILSSRFFDGASDTGSDCVPLITDISTDYGEGKLLQVRSFCEIFLHILRILFV